MASCCSVRTCLTMPGPGVWHRVTWVKWVTLVISCIARGCQAYNPYPFMNPIAHRTTIGRYFPDRLQHRQRIWYDKVTTWLFCNGTRTERLGSAMWQKPENFCCLFCSHLHRFLSVGFVCLSLHLISHMVFCLHLSLSISLGYERWFTVEIRQTSETVIRLNGILISY